MTEKRFLKILRKYRLGLADPKETKLIEDWLASLGPAETLSDQDAEILEEQYWKKISAHIATNSVKPRGNVVKFTHWNIVKVAASVSIVMFCIYYFATEKAALTNTDSGLKTVVNATSTVMDVALPDSSKVVLNPNSSIQYSLSFSGKNREVYMLKGEAFFDVKRDTLKPFYVYTGDIITRVLGTSFTIRALDNSDVTVVVNTGKVSVYKKDNDTSPPGNKPRVLLPNQQAVYRYREKVVSYELVDSPMPVISSVEMKKMKFEDAPVAEVFAALEKIYNVEIKFNRDAFSGCTLTMPLSDGGIYERLDIISQALGASYTVHQTQIIVEGGQGCRQ